VRVGAQVHVAGTAARGEALAGDAYVQTQNILDTIRSALEQAGSRVEDVVRTVIYVTDIGDADLVGRAHQEVFGAVRPASTMVQISALIRPEMRVEIEAFAVIDET
jgi:enamine deaminase RidA (YjgF/YER057c/UK114 family)